MLAVGAMLLAACGQSEEPLQVGIQRSAVDLAFTDETRDPPEPQVRRVTQEVPGEPAPAPAPRRTSPPSATPEPVPTGICPPASPNAVIDAGVASEVTKAPEEGVYSYFQSGTVEVDFNGDKTVHAVPEIAERQVRNVGVVDAYDASGYSTGESDQKAIQYEIVQQTPTTEIIATYQVREEGIGLMRMDRVRDAVTTTFKTGPNSMNTWGEDEGRGGGRHTGTALYWRHAPPGNNGLWQAESYDSESTIMLILNGTIVDRQQIDMCGDLVDTYRAETHEDMSDLSGDYTMWTDEDKPTVRNIATHMGPLPVYEEYNYTERVMAPSGNGVAPMTITWSYTSLLMSFDPEPLPN